MKVNDGCVDDDGEVSGTRCLKCFANYVQTCEKESKLEFVVVLE